MTVIAALKHDKGVTIGGDSAGVGYLNLYNRSDPKVFQVGNLLIGYTSSFRMAQLMRFGWHECEPLEALQPPAYGAGDDAGMRFMCRDFVPRVRYLWKQGGYLGKDSNSRETGGTFIVSWGDQIYTVEGDMQVAQQSEPFAACGCGEDLARGALFIMTSGIGSNVCLAEQPDGAKHNDARYIIRRSLEAAQQFSAGVRGPFTIKTIERKT